MRPPLQKKANNKMKEKIKKTIDFILIIIIFALTGSTTAFLSGIIMNALGAEPWTIQYIIGYLLFIFPLYQGLTLVYAFIFGKFDWFFNRQKMIINRIAEKVFKKSKSQKEIADQNEL